MSFTITKKGLVEIEQSEGFSSRPYLDTIAKPARWTIGFGETNGITAKTPSITRKEAERQLIRRFEKDYAWALHPFEKLDGFNQNMYDALASFIWNCGTGAVGPGTKVGQALRHRNWKTAAKHMLEWCKAGGVVIKGLLLRRERERALFLRPVRDAISRSVLTTKEREWVRKLEISRSVAKRNGGWSAVDPGWLRDAALAKKQLTDRIAQLKKQGDQKKAYRAQRVKLLSEIVAAV